jgi:hypothetical protein
MALHDRLYMEQLRKTCSDEALQPLRPTSVIDGVEFVHLNSAFALQEEGSAMHHCVGSYSDYIRMGRMVIFSVRKDGKRIATLSYSESARMRDEGLLLFWETHQFLGPCNTPITDTEILNAKHRFDLEVNNEYR